MLRARLLGLALLAACCVLAAPAQARLSFCSETGDFCYGAAYRDGDVKLTINLAARYFDRYTLCVTPAGYAAGRECKRFQILARGNSFGSTVTWSRHFTNEGGGKYHAVFKSKYGKLGPRVTFTR